MSTFDNPFSATSAHPQLPAKKALTKKPKLKLPAKKAAVPKKKAAAKKRLSPPLSADKQLLAVLAQALPPPTQRS